MAVLGFAAEFKDQASAGLNTLGNSYMTLRSRVNGSVDTIVRTTQKLNTIGAAASLIGLTAGAAVFGMTKLKDAAVTMAQQYEVSLTQVKYALGATEAEMERIKKVTREIGRVTIYSANDAAQAWYKLASAGLSGMVETGRLAGKSVSELAVLPAMLFATMSAGEVSLDQAAAFTGTVFNKLRLNFTETAEVGGKTIDKLTRAMDMFAYASKVSQWEMRDFPIAFNSMGAAIDGVIFKLEDALSIGGALRNLGEMSAQAGHGIQRFSMLFPMLSRQVQYFESGLGAKGRAGIKLKGILDIFGSKEAFKSSFVDAQGNYKNILDFFDAIQKGLQGKTQEVKSRALLALFGGSDMVKNYVNLMERYTFMADRAIYKVDEFGRYFLKNGDIIEDEVQRIDKNNIAWSKTGERIGEVIQLWEKGNYTGIKALRAQSDAIRQSQGEAAKYRKMMEETTWGIKELAKGIKETFLIIIGEDLNNMLRGMIRGVNWVKEKLVGFLQEHPRIRKFAVAFGVLAFGILAVVAAGAGLIALTSFALAQWGGVIAALTKTAVGMGANVAPTVAATGALAAYNTQLAAMNALQRGGSFPMVGKFKSVGKMSPNTFFSGASLVPMKSGLTGISGILSKIGGWITKLKGPLIIVGAVVGMLIGLFGLWKKNVWGIKDAMDSFAKSVKSAFEGLIKKIDYFFTYISAIFEAMFTGSISGDKAKKLGLAGVLGIAEFFRGGLGQFLRGIGLFLNKVKEFIKSISFMFEGVKQMSLIGGGIGAIIGLIVGGPLGALVGGLLGTVIGGLIAFIINLARNWEKFWTAVKTSGPAMKQAFFEIFNIDPNSKFAKFLTIVGRIFMAITLPARMLVKFIIALTLGAIALGKAVKENGVFVMFSNIFNTAGKLLVLFKDLHGYLLRMSWRGLKEAGGWIKDMSKPAFDAIQGAWTKTTDWIGDKWEKFMNTKFGKKLGEAWDKIADKTKEIWGSISLSFGGIIRGIVGMVNTILSWINGLIAGVYEMMAANPMEKNREEYRIKALEARKTSIQAGLFGWAADELHAVEKRKNMDNVARGILEKALIENKLTTEGVGGKKGNVMVINLPNLPEGVNAADIQNAIRQSLKDRGLDKYFDYWRIVEGAETKKSMTQTDIEKFK